ncbi:MAG: polyprenol phosphomannose-dependent alpha 1,6 mannosyltransferase MptB [Propionibacteriaceae bacterium]|jgi:hypothetical protein|nr:polyprenol phosphomannose-dependent alpha 1,6 mannosyltransferase MptB [Propionibacteriaceae bacterium]
MTDITNAPSVSLDTPSSSTTRWWHRLRQAWAQFPVKVGFIGTCAIAIGSLSPAYLPQASPFWDVLRPVHLDGEVGKVGGTLLAVAGIFLLADAWFRLRHTRYRSISHLWILAIWALPLLFSPPVFSHDAYSYGAQGWMIHNGQSPYEGGPGILPGPFADMVSWVWRYTPAPYGPLSLQIQHGLVDLSGFQPWLAAWLMRIPALVGAVLAVVLIPKIAKRLGFEPDKAIWFACLNPLLLIDFIGGEHNDSLMMGLVILALWVATKPKWWPVAALVVGVAAGIKQPALLAAWVLPLLTIPLASWKSGWQTVYAVARSVLAVGLAVGSFCLVTFATGLGFGWINAMKVPGLVSSMAPAWIIGARIQAIIDPGNSQYIVATNQVFMILGFVAVGVFVVVWGPRQPLRALAWSYIAFALSASALHSWYFLWGFLLLPLGKNRRQVPWLFALVVLFLLSYAAFNFAGRNGLWGQVAAYVTAPVWLGHIALYHKVWKPATPISPASE